jgi:hypothetical protein
MLGRNKEVMLFLLMAFIGFCISPSLAATSSDYYQAGLKLYDQHKYV